MRWSIRFHRFFVASKVPGAVATQRGDFTLGRENQAYYGASPSIGSRTEVRYKKGGAGCAVLRADATSGQTTLRVSSGVDPLLMLGIALLHEKSSLAEHYISLAK